MNQHQLESSNVRILVVGDVILDRYWFGDVSRISPEAPVPVISVTRSEDRAGGAANVVKNIVALGAKAMILSVIGEDEAADSLTQLLKDDAINSYLYRDSAFTTTLKLRLVAKQQQLIRADFENEPSHGVLMSKARRFTSLLKDAHVVVFSDYGKGVLSHISEMIKKAKQFGSFVVVDPKGLDYGKYRGADLITPNRQELSGIIGSWKTEQELETRAYELCRKLDIKYILLTRSEDGMTLFSGEGVRWDEKAETQEVFDVSGAGDTVVSALSVMLANGIPIQEAMRLANIAAGVVVKKMGTSTCSIDEINAKLSLNNQ